METAVYVIAGIIGTALVSGIAYLWYDSIRSRVEVGRLENENKAKEETNERMRHDNETYKRIHEEVMRVPDGDALKRLRSDWQVGRKQ